MELPRTILCLRSGLLHKHDSTEPGSPGSCPHGHKQGQSHSIHEEEDHAAAAQLYSSGPDVTENSIVLTDADDRDLTRLAGSAELQRHVKGALVDPMTSQHAADAPKQAMLGNL